MNTSDNPAIAAPLSDFDTPQGLCAFMDRAVCNFLAVDALRDMLTAAGFSELLMQEPWCVAQGGRYFVTVNDSAIFAFIPGTGAPSEGWRIVAAHSDSPGFRVKPSPEIVTEGGWVKLNTEVYGGPILYTWFDRPLSLAGRLVVRGEDTLHPRRLTVRITRPLLTIPHLAIHFNRQVNDGNHLSRQKDMLPVLGHVSSFADPKNALLCLVAHEAGIAPEEILDFDLMLYDTTPATLLGAANELVSSGRLDDLSMARAATLALIRAAGHPCRQTRVAAIFDNEETGSGTKQGAQAPVLRNILERLNMLMGGSPEDYHRAVASSFLVSADNAHGIHPNYPEKHDPTNHPVLGGGPVIKINANCKYMTDADSAAVFAQICREADVPVQRFVNHSDSAGGSTLGNLLTSQIALRGVDMGAPIWAMHSVRETASMLDHRLCVKAFTHFLTL